MTHPKRARGRLQAAINEGQGLGRSVAPELEAERAEFIYRCVGVWGRGDSIDVLDGGGRPSMAWFGLTSFD